MYKWLRFLSPTHEHSWVVIYTDDEQCTGCYAIKEWPSEVIVPFNEKRF